MFFRPVQSFPRSLFSYVRDRYAELDLVACKLVPGAAHRCWHGGGARDKKRDGNGGVTLKMRSPWRSRVVWAILITRIGKPIAQALQ